MSEFSVDAKGLFEVVGMFEEICRDCDQTGQILSESVRRIYNIVGNSSPYEQPLKKLEQAKGKESKRVTEAISDWALDTAKQ